MIENFQIFDKKLLLLYILDTAKNPLTIDQIAQLVSKVDDMTYFDICEYLDTLRRNDFIFLELIDSSQVYYLTENGKKTLEELLELIPGLDLYKLKKMISSNIGEIKQNYEVGTSILPLKDGQCKVNCYIKDGNEEIFNIMLYTGNKEDAKNISKNWQEKYSSMQEYILKNLAEE